MKTSRLLLPTSRSPHTASSSRSRVTTRPADFARHSKIENSVLVSFNSRPARATVRAAKSIVRSAKRNYPERLASAIRVRARTRARSTASENGLVT